MELWRSRHVQTERMKKRNFTLYSCVHGSETSYHRHNKSTNTKREEERKGEEGRERGKKEEKEREEYRRSTEEEKEKRTEERNGFTVVNKDINRMLQNNTYKLTKTFVQKARSLASIRLFLLQLPTTSYNFKFFESLNILILSIWIYIILIKEKYKEKQRKMEKKNVQRKKILECSNNMSNKFNIIF